jgi:hypothetical protein
VRKKLANLRISIIWYWMIFRHWLRDRWFASRHTFAVKLHNLAKKIDPEPTIPTIVNTRHAWRSEGRSLYR